MVAKETELEDAVEVPDGRRSARDDQGVLVRETSESVDVSPTDSDRCQRE